MVGTAAFGLVGVGLLAALAWQSPAVQDWLLQRLAGAVLRQAAAEDFDGLRVQLCGTSSPLPAPGRAQACVAIEAGGSLYVVDAGAGSAQVAALTGLPMASLRAVLLTHFHSDHIAALPEFNLNSWVAGRAAPLEVFGPAGVEQVVGGLNQAYGLDREYRVAHHGAELMRPDLGVMTPRPISVGRVLEHEGLSVTAFEVDHSPVRPAVGYRFDYRGRSVVVSGDAVVSAELIAAAQGADLLLQDALSLPIIQTLETAFRGTRMEKILHDIQDYHAATSDMAALVESTGVGQLALYHLVPAPRNALFEKIFTRDLPLGTILTEDGMTFELPAGSDRIEVRSP
jgi:ribonuclease Z